MWVLSLFMCPLMWQHCTSICGETSPHDNDFNSHDFLPSHDDYAATGIYRDIYDDDSAVGVFNDQDAIEVFKSPASNLATNGREDNNDKLTINVLSNKNDDNFNKLQPKQGHQPAQPKEMMMTPLMVKDIEKPLPMAQAMLLEEQLNKIDDDTGCKAEQGINNLNVATNHCDARVNYDMRNGNMSGKQPETEMDESVLTPILQRELINQFAMKYKQIRRINLFTCREQHSSGEGTNTTTGAHRSQPELNMRTVQLLQSYFTEGLFETPNIRKSDTDSDSFSDNFNDLLIKVIEIDHLSINQRSITSSGSRGESYKNNGRTTKNSSGGRTDSSSPNWLDQVLRIENYPQVVVVHLACGNASRRLLEMASTKALFNSMYHWLLLDDIVTIRRSEIDDSDGLKNEMNCSDADTGGWRSEPTSGSKQGNGSIDGNSNNTDKEVVNDSYKLAMQKILFSATDVVSASTSDSSKKYKNQLISHLAERTGLGSDQSISDGGVADEDDKEIIEKFLAKLNININTELILAKRRMRCISTRSTAGYTSSPSAATSISNASIAMVQPPIANFASSGTGDYTTFQRMDYYTLYDVWNPGRQYGGKLNISEVGEFSLQQGLWFADWYGHSATVMRRLNMHLAKIRCLVVVTHKNGSDSLHHYLTSHYDTHLDSMNRFNFALLSHVRDLFNFSFVLSKTSTWGYLKNGKFDGMIGALVRKQADIGGSPIFFRIERARVIDYTTQTWVARPCFIFRHPRSTIKDRIVFLQPFSNSVWCLLAACGIVTICLLWALTALESAEVEPKHPVKLITAGFKGRLTRWCGLQDSSDTRRKQRAGMFLESFLFYVGSICQQGLSFSTRSFAGRCVVIISLLFSFAIYQFYSASIVGTLLMEKPKTIRTLKDLIHSALEIGIEDIVYNRDYFLRTRDPDAQELYAKKVTSVPDSGFVDAPPDIPSFVTQAPLTEAQKAKFYRDILHSHETGAHAKTNEASNWYEPEFGVAKIKRAKFAFHVDVATAYKIIADTFTEKEICDLSEIQLFPPQKMVSIVQKGSPLRKAITYGLRRVTEVGLTEYEHKIWHSPRPRCVKKLHTNDLQVDMQTFTSALLVLMFGFVLSLMILAMEITHHRMWQKYAASMTIRCPR